jgi:hypothetical protein
LFNLHVVSIVANANANANVKAHTQFRRLQGLFLGLVGWLDIRQGLHLAGASVQRTVQ